jgi:hypothetical protein
MKTGYFPGWMMIAALGLLILAGCNKPPDQAVSQDDGKPVTSSQPSPAATILPDWAPKKPSPEFLRAAKILKPMPEESSGQADLTEQALAERYRRAMPAAWELFGSLSDQQLERFQNTKKVELPVKAMTKKQREALNHFFDTWREAMKGGPPEHQDYLVDLYKIGAREDLQNVLLVFEARASGTVAMLIYVQRPDGSLSLPLPLGIGSR